MKEIYPWNQTAWQQLQAQRQAGRLAHAYLFQGPSGIGKQDLADAFAASLLCQQPAADGTACGQCGACQQFEAGTHPDALSLVPEPGKTQIRIDPVRQLTARLGLKSHQGGFKVARIEGAHRLNTAAANSLLKTLEEPTDNTVLVLITDQPSRLLATIRSRCQGLRLVPPPAALARDWLAARVGEGDADLLLALADGAPLTALALAEGEHLTQRRAWFDQWQALIDGRQDAVAVAADWAGEAGTAPLEWMSQWLMDLIRLQQGETAIRNPDLLEPMQDMTEDMDPVTLHNLLEQVWQALRLAATPVNRQALIEDLLIAWTAAGRPRRRRKRA
ncbi:DNA polymerase III subunit delta' [Thiohalobacter thiocyanaticus]|uniref:DNA polymerase III subunit delta' n=1 Tax=Thiohalobacter thiocyanaticus TaxID=585455 RepID=A0A426QFQ7_9GAMM|nr:DNA polymerase III subunit delta' [Thiohalobacter thiocyanaticus]RRQ20579.1 DNA polymerase III subunit delta' [Thiohalobacter thiocyanaticus]